MPYASAQPLPPDGATRVGFGELMRLRATAAHIAATAPDAVAGLFGGLHRAYSRGRGLDFDEVRPYLPGDDYRALDWRVTARLGSLHTKVFHEERERTLYIVVDASPSMHFGTRRCFKWVLAARTAALFAWLEIARGDRVAGTLFGQGRRCLTTRASGGDPAAARLFQHLAAIRQRPRRGGTSRLPDALDHVRRHAPPGNAVLILSDFQNAGDGLGKRLAALARHQQLATLLVYDPMEARLPAASPLSFASDGQRLTLDARSRRVRAAFEAQFVSRVDAIGRLLRRHRIPLRTLSTDAPWPDRLLER